MTEPGPIFDSLVEDEMLLVTPMGGAGARQFAERHQLKSLALGLGNSGANPAEFQIGLPNAPRVSVGYDVYHMWLFASRLPTLWDALRRIADEAGEANAEDPDTAGSVHLVDDPDELLNALMLALPVLISTSCAYIDRVG